MKRYRLLHVHGSIEPELLPGRARDWRGLKKMLVDFLRTNRYEAEDALFYVATDERGRLLDVSSFSGGFMDEMTRRARPCPTPRA